MNTSFPVMTVDGDTVMIVEKKYERPDDLMGTATYIGEDGTEYVPYDNNNLVIIEKSRAEANAEAEAAAKAEATAAAEDTQGEAPPKAAKK